jgi:tetratricopeptide (TPR) repeat protein
MTEKNWQPESFIHYLRDTLIVAVILAVGLWIYNGRVETGKTVRAKGKEAKALMLQDTPQSYAQAERLLKEMIALEKSYPFAVASLGELYSIRRIDLGVEEASREARFWTERAGKLQARISERFGAVLLGLLGDERYAEAEKLGMEISQQTTSAHVVNGLGRALRAVGRLDEARFTLRKAADLEWRNPRFACDLADSYFDDGDPVNALNAYAKGIEAYSEHIRSLIGRSRSQIARGQRIAEAFETLQGVLALPAASMSPKLKAEALTGMAELRLFESKPSEALGFAGKAVEAYGHYGWAHLVKGRALAAQKEAAAAALEFDKAIELDRFAPAFYYSGSSAMAEAGDAAKATGLLDAFGKALKEDERLQVAYGKLLAKIGKPDEALVRFDKAIGLNGFNATAHYEKGALLLESKKDYEEAKKELELALESQEYFPDAYIKLGDIHWAKREWADSCAQYGQALVQLKQLQAPLERIGELRTSVHTRLIKQAGQPDMAKMWMTETGAIVR